MKLRRAGLASACGLVALFVYGAALSAASPAVGKKPVKRPCTASQATGTKGCTRAWVSRGCNVWAPLVKSTFALSGVKAARSPGRAGVGSLACTFQPAGSGTDESFQIQFFNAAVVKDWATFEAEQDQTGEITGCVPSATSDPSTATPRGHAQPIAGLGAKGIAIDVCPGGGFGVWHDDSVASGPSTPQVIVQLAHTQRRVLGAATGPASSLPKLIALERQLLKKFP